MSLVVTGQSGSTDPEECVPPAWISAFGVELERLTDRLRSLSDVRLEQELVVGVTRADAARVLAQRLADAALGVERRNASGPPLPRPLPDLGPLPVGDQVAVTGHDLSAAARDLRGRTQVWSASERRSVAEIVGEASAAVRALRLSL